MGWSYSQNTLAQQKQHILTYLSLTGYLVEHKCTNYGRHFWLKLYREGINEDKSFIVLYLFEKHDGEWGQKDIDESMYPYYFDCPKSLIDHEGTNKESKRWRKDVMASK